MRKRKLPIEDDLLVTIVTKGKIVKEENGAALISIDCSTNDIDLLKKEVIEKPARAIEEDLEQRRTRDAELKQLLAGAIAELKEDRETYTADLMGGLATSLVNVTRMNSQIFIMVKSLETSVSELQKAVDEIKTNITNNAMAHQRRHKIFTDYVWQFNNSIMCQLNHISTRQQHFNEACKPTLQDLVNYMNRGVDL